jgi:PAS domain S-box-containing protein
MSQTEARKTLKDAPIMWRRINSIGIILDCNSTYATNLGYAKSEILGKPVFEHVPKESWESMNESLKIWFETGKVTDRKITFIRQDKSTFSGLLQATSLYDENKNLIGSNTVIFDLTKMSEENIAKYQQFFEESSKKLKQIKENEYEQLDKESKSEYEGLKQMFEMLLKINLLQLK